nr:hypothetical protein [Tanacetum cinerariifolium]
MDPAGQAAAAAPSSSAISAADKGKAPMVDDSIPVDLLTEQERVLKNLHDYQLGEDLAKKLQAEQEAEFARQQEELANERLGMLLMRKRRELAEQSRVKPMNKTQQRDFMRDFVKNQSASVYNQGWTMKQRTTFRPKPTLEAPSTKRARQGVPLAAHAASSQVLAASSQVPAGVTAAPFIAADVSVFAVSTTTADVSAAPTTTTSIAEVHADESRLDDNKTASEQVSAEHTVDTSTTVAFTSGVSHATPSSLRKRYFSSPMIHVPRAGLVIHPPG